MMPANSTNVTPSEMPPTLIFPRSTPNEMTTAKISTMCATEPVSTNKFSNQFID